MINMKTNIKFVSILTATGLVAVAGCATAPNWQHTAIRDNAVAARQLVIDDAYCTQVASGSAPMPEIVAPETPQTANVTIRGSTYNTTTGQRTYGTYTGQVTTSPSGGFAGGFASGLSSGASLGAAISAQRERERIHKGCMFAKGWMDTPQAATPNEPPTLTVALPEASRIYATPHDEWYADVEEFMRLYPAYRSGALHDALNERVKAVANTPQYKGLNGQQILMTAHAELKSMGRAALEPTDDLTLKSLVIYQGAANGNPEEQAAMGIWYFKGSGGFFPEDHKRAALWSQRAAYAGNAGGQLQHGLLMFRGFGHRMDRVEGFRWIQRAAKSDPKIKTTLEQLRMQLTADELRQVQ